MKTANMTKAEIRRKRQSLLKDRTRRHSESEGTSDEEQYESGHESDDNSNRRKKQKTKIVQKSAKVSPSKKISKLNEHMTSREVLQYCENPDNTSVRDKLISKTTYVKRAIDEFITTRVFRDLKFAPSSSLAALLRSAENYSKTISWRKGVEDDDFEDYFKGKVSTCFTKLRHATTQNTKRTYMRK